MLDSGRAAVAQNLERQELTRKILQKQILTKIEISNPGDAEGNWGNPFLEAGAVPGAWFSVIILPVGFGDDEGDGLWTARSDVTGYTCGKKGLG